MVVAAVVVLPYMHAYRHLSPYDELVHVDYLVKAQHFELVDGGEKVGQVAMREQACRGHDVEGLVLPPCDSEPFDPNAFPELGYNTAYPDPPLYYWVTAAGATVLDSLPGVHDIVTAARGIGVLWLGAGLALTFLLARRLGSNTLSAAGATLVMASAPAVAHASATVTSDAPALLVGALLCLVALGVVEGRVRWWWLVPAAACAGLVKVTTLTVMGLVVVYLLLQLVPSRSRPATAGEAEPQTARSAAPGRQPERRTVWLSLAAVVGGGVLAIASWAVVTGATASGATDLIPMREQFRIESLDWSDNVAPNLLVLLSPLQIAYLPPSMNEITLVIVLGAVNLLLVAGVVGYAWLGPRGRQSTRMAIATVASMVLSGPALVLLLYLGSHTSIAVPPRYGLSLLPAGFAVVAVAASRRRAGGWGLLGLGAAALAALLAQTL